MKISALNNPEQEDTVVNSLTNLLQTRSCIARETEIERNKEVYPAWLTAQLNALLAGHRSLVLDRMNIFIHRLLAEYHGDKVEELTAWIDKKSKL